MKEDDVCKRAFAMPLTSPAYPPGPYRFLERIRLAFTGKLAHDDLRMAILKDLRQRGLLKSATA
jgi:acetoacetate decarboxylase